MNNDKRKWGVWVAAFIVSGGLIVKWLTQDGGDDKWFFFAFIALGVAAVASVWLERKQ